MARLFGCAGVLFGSKAFYGICESRSDGLVADGQQDDEGRCGNGEQEDAGTDRDAVFEVQEITVHDPSGERGGDEEGDDHQPGEFATKEPEDVGNAGAKNLADADLLCLTNRHEGGQAIEAEAADEYRDGGE